MATFKRLTSVDGVKVDINMDNVAYVRPVQGHTQIAFCSNSDGHMIVNVKELLDDIRAMKPL